MNRFNWGESFSSIDAAKLSDKRTLAELNEALREWRESMAEVLKRSERCPR